MSVTVSASCNRYTGDFNTRRRIKCVKNGRDKSRHCIKMAVDTIRLDEYSGIIENRLALVWIPDTVTPWLPTEFMLSQYITRILVCGRTSPISAAMSADPSWTQVWRSPGGKEWSCLFGVLPHMPGPVLIVVAPDVGLSSKIVAGLHDITGIAIVMRNSSLASWEFGTVKHVFFPVLGDHATVPLISVAQEWIHRSLKPLDLKALMPQLAVAGYGLTLGDGVWQWYRPADSLPLTTLTMAQIGKQIQAIGTLLSECK